MGQAERFEEVLELVQALALARAIYRKVMEAVNGQSPLVIGGVTASLLQACMDDEVISKDENFKKTINEVLSGVSLQDQAEVALAQVEKKGAHVH